MKLSEVTISEVKSWIGIDFPDDDPLLEIILTAAMRYILDYTGLTVEKADEIATFPIALMAICADMYDNRSAEVSANVKENPTVRTILGGNAVNYL